MSLKVFIKVIKSKALYLLEVTKYKAIKSVLNKLYKLQGSI